MAVQTNSGGEGGIRTPGTLRFSGFQDRRNRPLCHLSAGALPAAARIVPGDGANFLLDRFERCSGIVVRPAAGIPSGDTL